MAASFSVNSRLTHIPTLQLRPSISSSAPRPESLKAIYAGGENGAYETFCKLRWSAKQGKPVRDVT